MAAQREREIIQWLIDADRRQTMLLCSGLSRRNRKLAGKRVADKGHIIESSQSTNYPKKHYVFCSLMT
jgi:hypothetical protein